MFQIVLVAPEIPHNTGAAGRLALATGSTLHLVEPLGFSLEDKYLKRSGLDYWQDVDVRVWPSFQALRETAGESAKFWYLTTKGVLAPWCVPFRPGDFLVFGCETRGLPPEILDTVEPGQRLRIPMCPGGTRSLNLSTAVAITLYEAVRQNEPANW